jgi:microcystin-dependent protein
MPLYYRDNFIQGTLAANILVADATMRLLAGHNFTTDASKIFRVTIWDETTCPNPSDDSNREIVTAQYSGVANTYNITRAQESTSDNQHLIGNRVALTYTAGVSNADLSVIGSKEVDESLIADGYVLKYNIGTDKIEYGLQATSGYSGYSGRSGYSGANPGASGYSGYSGANPGASGYSGPSGYSGYSGANPGASGYSGKSGYSGYNGSGGSSGKSGYSGYSGQKGDQGIAGGGSLPVGSIVEWTTNTAPDDWLLCDGAEYDQAVKVDLYNVIGTTFNTGGETAGYFRVPNKQGRVGVGQDTGYSGFSGIGTTGGEKTHTLTAAETASHTHIEIVNGTAEVGVNEGGPGTGKPLVYPMATVSGAYGSQPSVTTKANTGDTAHNNLQPYIVFPYIIKYQVTTISGSQEYTTGSGNWTCPAGITTIYITMVGGGGTGGQNGYASPSPYGAGGGGGSSGGHLINKIYTTTPGNTYAYSVGAAGAATTFGTGTVLTASAGVNGTDGAVRVPGVGGKFSGNIGGTASAKSIGLGNDGGDGVVGSGSGSTGGQGGNGGPSIWGAGGVGGDYNEEGAAPAAGAYGAGGGGAGGNSDHADVGGAGLGGYILIQW